MSRIFKLSEQQSTKRASKRLTRDLQEWKNCCDQAISITAAPLATNIFEWHVNFAPTDGPLKGTIFHLIILFPNTFPMNPPRVSICTILYHPNVFPSGSYGIQSATNGGYCICLDMLTLGWSPAYSVSSLLFQLLSFLIADKAPQTTGEIETIQHTPDEINEMQKQSLLFKCPRCLHNYQSPFPPLYTHTPNINKINQKLITQTQTKKSYNYAITKKNIKPSINIQTSSTNINIWAQKMYPDIEASVIDYCTIIDLLILTRVCKSFRLMVNNSKYLAMNKYSCYYHRINLRYSALSRIKSKYFNENEIDYVANNLILGYGLTPTFFRFSTNFKIFFGEFQAKKNSIKIAKKQYSLINVSRDPNLSFPILKKVDVTFDLLSSDAFTFHSVRQTPRNDQKFTHFIPIYINGINHGERALEQEKKFTLRVYQTNQRYLRIYHPMMSVHLICNIMSSLVINLMNSIYDSRVHHSINVLETYFHFYHLLLAIYHKYYKIVYPLIQQKCINFVNNPALRHMKYVPNIDSFMIWFTLCKNIPSLHAFKSLLEEYMIRRVRWLVKKYGLEYECQTENNISPNWAFKGSITSLRLFMFQHFFLSKCCSFGIKSPHQKFEELNRNFGCISNKLLNRLQIFCKKMTNIQHWKAFFNVIGITFPGYTKLKQILKQSIVISLERKYHRSPIQDAKNQKKDAKKQLKILIYHRLFFKYVADNNIEMVKKLLHINDTINSMNNKKPKKRNRNRNSKKHVNSNNNNKPQKRIKNGRKKWVSVPLQKDGIKDINNIDDIIDDNYNDNDDKKEKEKLMENKILKIFENGGKCDNDIILDINMTDSNCRTPLFIAANQCNLEMIQLLTENKFNATVKDINNKTAIGASLDGKNKLNAKKMNKVIKLLKKRKKQQERQIIYDTRNKNVYCAKYLKIYGLPITSSKDDVRNTFKRYSFNNKIDDECIFFKSDYIVVKIRDPSIIQKVNLMNEGFQYGQVIYVTINERNEENNLHKNLPCNHTLSVHNFNIINGKNETSKKLKHIFLNSYDIQVGVDKYGDPYAIVDYANLDDSIREYQSSQNYPSNYIINGNVLRIHYTKKVMNDYNNISYVWNK